MAKAQDFRINSEIRAREVRVIDSNGDQLGIMTLNDARAIAEGKSMDLVEVAGTAQPPVVRIMDFHKFRYEQRKKVQESRKKSTSPAQQMKEVKLRSRTEAHDIEFKTSHIRRFLAAGHRVKITVFFKGREISRPDMGKAMLLKVLGTITDVAAAEGEPRLEGRNMSVVVVPTKQKPEKPEKSAAKPPKPAEGEHNAEG
ncbi:MAG TPA: translation initiation factor IF-3 [Candidatus Limnocylindrales bacterium]|nr:translation initiation factor IF-3 [Candidatus Limnocylindrales bacterium]